MKVKIHTAIYKTMEVEITDPALAELDAFWRKDKNANSNANGLLDRAIKAVEKETGIPFGREENGKETITYVSAMDDYPILEW